LSQSIDTRDVDFSGGGASPNPAASADGTPTDQPASSN
jgi:hypothetical protein